ncbi:unnamed protein product [Musa hybrid cultivar]
MAKKKPSPLHPLSRFFLLLPLLLCLSARAKAKLCPPCGSTSVPFPLSTGAGCGDPSYKIRCDNATKSLFFDALNGSSYPLNSSLPFNVSSSNTIMLLNCTARLLLSPLNCSSNSLCHAGSNATCRADPSSSGTIRRCFCIDSLRWDPFAGVCVNSDKSNHGPLIAGNISAATYETGIVSGLGAAAVVTVAGFLLYRRQRRIREARERLAKERQDILNANNSSGRSAKHFTAREIKRATSNFAHDNLLGSGGYGDVFKGILADGTPVAVKCAKLGNVKSTEQVLNEVRVLSQVNHRSLVRLLGCCVDLDQPLMVYEFIPNGTLFDHFHGLRPLLPWRRRLAIAHQTAEGLAYLHSSAMPPIYHRDVKSSNILLDDKLNAKVADFGLSRLAEPGISHVSTCAQGTLGYLDPEYYRNYQLTDKSDVYSYGVVLLELLTSQKAIDFNRGPDDLDTMKALGFLAMGCLEEKRQNRPSMKEVAEEIEYIINILDAGGSKSTTAHREVHETSTYLDTPTTHAAPQSVLIIAESPPPVSSLVTMAVSSLVTMAIFLLLTSSAADATTTGVPVAFRAMTRPGVRYESFGPVRQRLPRVERLVGVENVVGRARRYEKAEDGRHASAGCDPFGNTVVCIAPCHPFTYCVLWTLWTLQASRSDYSKQPSGRRYRDDL